MPHLKYHMLKTARWMLYPIARASQRPHRAGKKPWSWFVRWYSFKIELRIYTLFNEMRRSKNCRFGLTCTMFYHLAHKMRNRRMAMQCGLYRRLVMYCIKQYELRVLKK